MRDIAAVKKELEDWGRGIVLLFPDEKGYKNFDPKEFGDLPGTITYGLDIDGAIQKGDGYSDEIAKRQYLADLLDRRYVQSCRICLSRLYNWLGRAVNESHT